MIYSHEKSASNNRGTSATLDDMGIWSYGLPYAERLADGDVMVLYYAGSKNALDIHYARLSL